MILKKSGSNFLLLFLFIFISSTQGLAGQGESQSETKNPSGSIETHEYNSDRSTHGQIEGLLKGNYAYESINEFINTGNEHYFASFAAIETILFAHLREGAESLAKEIAARAGRRAKDPERWKEALTLGHLVAEVLFDQELKRGPLPSQEEREKRVKHINQLIDVSSGSLRLALLALPVRDRNPAKNDGPYPDLGEAISLLRLWIIAESIRLAWDAYYSERDTFLERFRTGASKELAAIRGLLTTPSEEPKESARLQKHLHQASLTTEWLMTALARAGQGHISVFAVRDSKRYPSFATDIEDDISAYTKGLNYFVKALKISPAVEVMDIEDIKKEQKNAELVHFQKEVETVYNKKLEAGSKVLCKVLESLMKANGRAAFHKEIEAVEGISCVGNLVEPILHGRWHPELAHLSTKQRIEFLAEVFYVKTDSKLEILRQAVLKSSLLGAIQYMAAYEANTGSKNDKALDDIEFLLPKSLRLSIHQKPESCGQFTINIGPNPHRTPWHGTALLRESSRGGSVSMDTRLSLELKREKAVPILLLRENGTEVPEALKEIANSGQPLLWIARSLASIFVREGANDGDGMIRKAVEKRVKVL